MCLNSILNMLGKVPSISFKGNESPNRTPSNQSYNATLKHYHNEIHQILLAAITEDEHSKQGDEQKKLGEFGSPESGTMAMIFDDHESR